MESRLIPEKIGRAMKISDEPKASSIFSWRVQFFLVSTDEAIQYDHYYAFFLEKKLGENKIILGKKIIFGKKFHFWEKFQKFHFWEKISFLGKNFIFGKKFHFWEKISFLGKILFLGKKIIFGEEISFLGIISLGKNFIFGKNLGEKKSFLGRNFIFFMKLSIMTSFPSNFKIWTAKNKIGRQK